MQPDCEATVTIMDDDGESLLLHSFTVVYACTYILSVEITVRFDNAMYISDENIGVVKPLLVLSNPSSLVETAQVINIHNITGSIILCSIGY